MTRLKAERMRRGWTQQDLGYHARIGNADISRYERGWSRPYPSQAKRLAEVLEVSVASLFDEVDAPKEWSTARV